MEDENTELYVKEFQKEKIRRTKTYELVIKHRETCTKWKEGLTCKECWGGGLVNFVWNLFKEIE